MATVEQINLAMQAIQNLSNLKHDMRRNARAYKERLTAGETEADVLEVAERDAAEYRRRQALIADDDSDLAAGLAALGVTDYGTTAAALRSAEDTFTKSSKPLRLRADDVRTAVPNVKRLF